MKKAILVGMAVLTLISGQASIGPQTAQAALTDDIKNTIDTGSDAVKEAIDKVVQKFKDITGHWAESSILQALKKGYVSGYPDGNFLPNNKVTRAEFVKMTVSALDLKVGSASGSWYTPYVTAAETAGIYKSGDFNDTDWTKPMSREEMSKVAVRALGITNVEPNQWMYMATKNGIISGTAPGVLSPEGTTTRAQAITVIERVLSVKKGEKLQADKYAVSAAEILWHKTNILTVLPRYFTDSFDGKPFDHKSLVHTSPDGKAACSITQLVAIDLGDPKDPNRKLIENTEYAWIGNGKYYKLKDSDGYALMGISETKITGKLNVNQLLPCRIQFQNDDWYNMPEDASNPKKPNRTYGIMPWDAKYEQYKNFVDVSKTTSGTLTFATGTLFPKGDFSSNKPFRIMFAGMGSWQGDVITIYNGKLNTDYHQ
ncbi:S-layer homology domain-containing protein [Paenibacillus taichungensis]